LALEASLQAACTVASVVAPASSHHGAGVGTGSARAGRAGGV